MLRYKYINGEHPITDDALAELLEYADNKHTKQFCHDNAPNYDVIKIGTKEFDNFLCKQINKNGGYKTLTSWVDNLNLNTDYQKDAIVVKNGSFLVAYNNEEEALGKLVYMICNRCKDLNDLDISALL